MVQDSLSAAFDPRFADAVPDRRVTFGDPPGIGLGPLEYLPGVALVRQEAALVGDLLDDGGRARMAELYSATDEAETYIDNTFAREDARLEAYRRRIAKIHEATGVQLANPMELASVNAVGNGFFVIPDLFGTQAVARDRAGDELATFRTKLDELKVQFPDRAALFAPNFDPGTSAIFADAEARRRRADTGGEGLSGVTRLAATFADAARGSLRDPLQVATLFLGGGAGVAKGVVGRIGQTILAEAIVNDGVMAAASPAHGTGGRRTVESGVVP